MTGAHGMGLGTAERDWPKLTQAELVPVFAAYPGLGTPLSVEWHSPRPFAASGVVRAESGPVFVKRHDARVRTVAWLEEEHRFIAHLRAHGAEAPSVLKTVAGDAAVSGAACVYEVHALALGEDRYRDARSWEPVRGLEDAAAIGRALAGLHKAAAGFLAPWREAKLLVAGDGWLRATDPIGALANDPALSLALADRPWREDFRRVLLPFHAQAQAAAAACPPSWVHGDLHASNCLWRGGEVATVIDFGLCNRASFLFDVATALERNSIEWLRLGPNQGAVGRPDLARAILEAYRAEGGRLQGLEHILPLVHVDFALSELAYFHAVTGSQANASLAYNDFLLGHAAWFATGAGRAYLAEIADAVG